MVQGAKPIRNDQIVGLARPGHGERFAQYSLFYSALRSISRYCSSVRCVLGGVDMASRSRPLYPCPHVRKPALYAVRMASDLSPEMAACAAARRAIGTRYGEQLT